MHEARIADQDGPWDRILDHSALPLLILSVLQIALWLPSYLTWPWWADHDVFATMAHGWDSGLLPYRDLVSNNFPGTIYLFWGLGKIFGWGSVRSLYVADASLLFVLIGMILVWSQVRLGRFLPGTIAVLALTSGWYFDLDFTQTAQRDWHATALVVLGLLAVQIWPGRVGWWLSALSLAAGLLIRPQVVLIAPAMLLAVTERKRLSGESFRSIFVSGLSWSTAVGFFAILGFLPLIFSGVLGDFVNSLRAVALGSSYNKKSIGTMAFLIVRQVTTLRSLAVIVGVSMLSFPVGRSLVRSSAVVWLIAMIGTFLYEPLSPGKQAYLAFPGRILWAITLAVLVELILESEFLPKQKFLTVVVLFGLTATTQPYYCQPKAALECLVALRQGRELREAPAGYYHSQRIDQFRPPWEDYRDLLSYLRNQTAPETRVANLLSGVALTGPTGRLPALPAESATWLSIVKPDDEMRFVRVLESSPNSVVVWSPNATARPGSTFKKLEEVVRRLYVPEARFGLIEVWRRRTPDAPGLKTSSTDPRP
jgi:hypothetical protein